MRGRKKKKGRIGGSIFGSVLGGGKSPKGVLPVVNYGKRNTPSSFAGAR